MKAAMGSPTETLWLLATCNRLQRHLGQTAEGMIATWQPAAQSLAQELNLLATAVALFGEEVSEPAHFSSMTYR